MGSGLRRPKLRVYIMHAGWPMLDELLAVLWTHPQVNAEVGAICFALSRKEFHHYLERIVDAGFGSRVMFGSDQLELRALSVSPRRSPTVASAKVGRPR